MSSGGSAHECTNEDCAADQGEQGEEGQSYPGHNDLLTGREMSHPCHFSEFTGFATCAPIPTPSTLSHLQPPRFGGSVAIREVDEPTSPRRKEEAFSDQTPVHVLHHRHGCL